MDHILRQIQTDITNMTNDNNISCLLTNGSKFMFKGKKRFYYLLLEYDIIRSRAGNVTSMCIQLKVGTLVRCLENSHVLMVCGTALSDKLNIVEPYFCEQLIIPKVSQFYYLKDPSCGQSKSQDTPASLIINSEATFTLPEGIIVKFIGTIQSLALFQDNYKEDIIKIAKSPSPLYQITSLHRNDKFHYSLYIG